MSIIKILFHESRLLIGGAVCAGFCSAFLGITIIHSIGTAIDGRFAAITPGRMAAFFGLLLAAALANLVAQGLLASLGQLVVYKLRKLLVERILATDFEQLEKLGGHRLYASITGDIDDIAGAFNNAPIIVVNCIVSLAGFAYLGFLSMPLFAFILALLIAGVVLFETLLGMMRKFIKLVREEQDRMHKHYEAIIYGAKELGLNSRMRDFFYDKVLLKTLESIKRLNTGAQLSWVLAFNWSQFLFFAILALAVVAGALILEAPSAVLTGYVLTILFLRTPIGIVVDFMPALSRGNVALRKVEALQLNNLRTDVLHAADIVRPFESLHAIDIEYEYTGADAGHNFHLGPVSLDIYPGQIIFLAGGNGSGKSTLAKLLTGLYRPHRGELLLNNERVSEGRNRHLLRNHFAAVFSDLYLFDFVLDPRGAPAAAEKAAAMLERLELAGSVKIVDGKLSTTRLSQGQRRRLGLLTAYMSERPIFLFDEWAADQDSYFKDYFYNEVLADLKAQGKAVIVISHDDRYFGCADKLYRLENGVFKR